MQQKNKMSAENNYSWIDGNKFYLRVHIQTNAKKDAIIGKYGENKLKISIKASPIEGKANDRLLDFLARHFGIAKTYINIIKGRRSRDKLICIDPTREAPSSKLFDCAK